jgi:hypothetical protein
MSDEISDDVGDAPTNLPEIPQPVIEIPDVPEIPEISGIPDKPDVIESPDVPDDSDVIVDPDISDEPEIIEEPEVPEEPEVQDDPQVQQAVDSIGSIDNLNPGTWDSLSIDDRLETLQNIEDRMAEIQGRPPVEIYIDDTLGPTTFGGYDPYSETISINASHLNSDMPVDEFIDTIVHEGRHAYQDYAIKNPGFLADTEQVNSWAENQQNYLGADEYGQEIYANQPIEADAWNYATQIRNTLIVNNWGK